MNERVRQATTAEDQTLWQEYVTAHADATPFHAWEWRNVVEDALRMKTYYLMAEIDGKIRGVLPFVHFKTRVFGRFLVSYPYAFYGGILADDSSAQNLLLQGCEELARELKVEFVELRHNRKMGYSLPAKTHKVTFVLPLPDSEEELWKSFKSKSRSQIKRPMKEEMYAACGGLDLLGDYYHVFCRNMRDLGTPVYKETFFEAILQNFPKQSAIVVTYSKDKLPIAAAFLVMHRDTVEIPWASSLREYNRLSPNMLLYWEVLRFSIAQGYKVFDFGRCTPDTGTYKFKKQWGAEEKPLYYYYLLVNSQQLPEINPHNPKYELFVKMWRKAPLFLTNVLGPSIIRHIP